ncbi:hypothetical protein SAMN04515647_3008 [Cohaesibacter sp. ES.047]|nr:hypothetical protein SAMN04515647_3008 [Cohaesibacter sp. ES.047]
MVSATGARGASRILTFLVNAVEKFSGDIICLLMKHSSALASAQQKQPRLRGALAVIWCPLETKAFLNQGQLSHRRFGKILLFYFALFLWHISDLNHL